MVDVYISIRHCVVSPHHNVVVPNGALFTQWIDAFSDHFRDLWSFQMMNDSTDSKYLQDWISPTAVRKAPFSLDKWPQNLQYGLDTKKAKASNVVIISPYDTHKERTSETQWVPTDKKIKMPRRK